mmetsp:Transcript_23369/g.74867  ORF Transcript_23369/g.74867 Transcript_23369/m.74867 type:complete len:325 (+) Transcript_23369:344-1318(+)
MCCQEAGATAGAEARLDDGASGVCSAAEIIQQDPSDGVCEHRLARLLLGLVVAAAHALEEGLQRRQDRPRLLRLAGRPGSGVGAPRSALPAACRTGGRLCDGVFDGRVAVGQRRHEPLRRRWLVLQAREQPPRHRAVQWQLGEAESGYRLKLDTRRVQQGRQPRDGVGQLQPRRLGRAVRGRVGEGKRGVQHRGQSQVADRRLLEVDGGLEDGQQAGEPVRGGDNQIADQGECGGALLRPACQPIPNGLAGGGHGGDREGARRVDHADCCVEKAKCRAVDLARQGVLAPLVKVVTARLLESRCRLAESRLGGVARVEDPRQERP